VLWCALISMTSLPAITSDGIAGRDGAFKAFTYDELVARDKASLTFSGSDESLEEHRQPASSTGDRRRDRGDLQAALDQFAAIASSLSKRQMPSQADW